MRKASNSAVSALVLLDAFAEEVGSSFLTETAAVTDDGWVCSFRRKEALCVKTGDNMIKNMVFMRRDCTSFCEEGGPQDQRHVVTEGRLQLPRTGRPPNANFAFGGSYSDRHRMLKRVE